MEEDPTPLPTFGRRKSLVLDAEGHLMGEEPLLATGRKEAGFSVNKILLCQVANLGSIFTPVRTTNKEIVKDSRGSSTLYNKLVGDEDCIIYEHVRDTHKSPVVRAFLRAGPREHLHFDPKTVNAAIVTCGSVSPGLNTVIHHLYETLKHNYECNKVWGICGGYSGFFDPAQPPIDLDQADLEFLQHKPGSILGCSSGPFDIEKIMDFIEQKQINQLYVIGGDGTHRGAHRIAVECVQRNINLAVAGIPKSIDNDVDLIDRSFGFMTAVEAAQEAIRSATIEAKCNLPNGIGVVKLMGRSSGYIAAYATLASGDVDLCLIPEVPVVLSGRDSCLDHLMKRVERKGYAVVVVAEGAGGELTKALKREQPSEAEPPIGLYIKSEIERHYKSKGKTATVKYIDPSYMIRSVAANAFDQIYCMQLAQNAVHGAMAGYTSFSAGVINNRTVFIPIQELVENSPKQLNPMGRTWERVLCLTKQPSPQA